MSKRLIPLLICILTISLNIASQENEFFPSHRNGWSVLGIEENPNLYPGTELRIPSFSTITEMGESFILLDIENIEELIFDKLTPEIIKSLFLGQSFQSNESIIPIPAEFLYPYNIDITHDAITGYVNTYQNIFYDVYDYLNNRYVVESINSQDIQDQRYEIMEMVQETATRSSENADLINQWIDGYQLNESFQ